MLDIGLPKQNGIQAARQIRKSSPGSTIVFLTQDSSPDVVQAALGAGGRGYVYKGRAGCDLSRAVAAVLQGKQFVSDNLRRPRFAEASYADAPGADTLETSAAETGAPERHEVVFYSSDDGFLDTYTEFIAAALRRGDLAISVTTKPHRDGLRQRLRAEGFDVDTAIEKGSYVPADVADVLSAVMVNGLPDAALLLEKFDSLAGVSDGDRRRIAVCGECAPYLLAEGNVDAAIRVEQLCNELGAIRDVDILCAFSIGNFRNDEYSYIFQNLCAEHSAVHSL